MFEGSKSYLLFFDVIYENTRDGGTEKTVKNTTRSAVFLTRFDIIRNLMKQCLECVIVSSQSKQN